MTVAVVGTVDCRKRHRVDSNRGRVRWQWHLLRMLTHGGRAVALDVPFGRVAG